MTGYRGISCVQLLKVIAFCVSTSTSWQSDYHCTSDKVHLVVVLVQCLALVVYAVVPMLTVAWVLVKNLIEIETP
eukprot:UN16948